MDKRGIIQISDLSFSYDHVRVLEKVNISIVEGDFVSLVGPNGGGKTTLLKLILGLLAPTQGTIRVFGLSPNEARLRIGYLPQYAYLDPQFPVTVTDVVLMGRLGPRHPIGKYSSVDRQVAEQVMHEVGVTDLRHRSFSSLSGGQRQRTLIARALACQPALLLLDEPTASLDMQVEEEFYELLKKLNDRLSIMLVSHDLGFVSQYVNTVVCVKQKVVAHPTCEITAEIINEMYGGVTRLVRHDHKLGSEEHGCLDS